MNTAAGLQEENTPASLFWCLCCLLWLNGAQPGGFSSGGGRRSRGSDGYKLSWKAPKGGSFFAVNKQPTLPAWSISSIRASQTLRDSLSSSCPPAQPPSSMQLPLSLSLSLAFSLFITPHGNTHPPNTGTPTHHKPPLLTRWIKEDENVIFVIPSCFCSRRETTMNNAGSVTSIPQERDLLLGMESKQEREEKEEQHLHCANNIKVSVATHNLSALKSQICL